ncbi:MAG: hypothetical protein ACOCW1_02140 [Chitinispirillaceae bacterium]
MRTETSSTVSRKLLNVVVGYNLPFLLWTAYAAQRAFGNGSALWQCPVQKILGWCPGCGLTASYVHFIRTGFFQNAFFILIFSALLLNALFSFRKALLILKNRSS